MSGIEGLSVERAGDVAVLRLDDAASMNALTEDIGAGLTAALKDAERTAGAVVLTGGERAFSSGAKLSGEAGLGRPGEDLGAVLERTYNPLMLTIRDLGVPFVTAVRGAAAGIGASLAMSGDIIVAGRSAYFLEAFARIGLVPDGGASVMLTRAVGRVRAMEMMLLADKLPAETAHEWGLVTRLVDDGDVEPVALDIAARLAAGPRLALRLIRRAAWAASESTFEETLQREAAWQSEAGRHPDFAEGVAAFRAKRPPVFGRT